MATNKIEIRNSELQIYNTIVDITDTTSTASTVLAGKAFYLASGEKVTGTLTKETISETLTPTTTQQILNTTNKLVDVNLTVNAIPDKYKLETNIVTPILSGDYIIEQ